MTPTVSHIARSEKPSSRVEPTGKQTGEPFGQTLKVEEATVLMRELGVSAQWEKIRQKNDFSAAKVADLILERERIKQSDAFDGGNGRALYDQITKQLSAFGISLPLSEDVPGQNNVSRSVNGNISTPLNTQNVRKTSILSANDFLNEENLLIFSMEIPEIGVNETILGYGDQQVTQLPLGEVARVLDFSIEVDEQAGTAQGWFISEDRTFLLDVQNKSLAINGLPTSFDSSAISVGEGDIFVDSRLLSEWFPVDFEVSLGELAVEITPREKLPLQIRYEREQKRLKLLGKEDMALKFPLIENDYAPYSFPVMDVALSAGFDESNQNNSGYKSRYSIVAEGDLAYMGARVYLSGDEDSLLDRARVRLERDDPDAGLLGPLKARKVSLGDLSPVDLPVLSNAGVERGVAISNADLLRSTDFDTTRFEGDMLPGWDVELYRNGALIDTKRVDTDGRYLFDEIPVYYGSNSFQVLAFGPQGQRRVADEKEINVGSGMLNKGSTEYGLSVTQRKNTVLGIDEENQTDNTDDGLRFNGRFRLGLNNNISVSTGISSVQFDDTRHNYLQGGVSGTFSSYYGQADIITDTAGGSGVSLQGQTAIGDVNIRAKYEKYFDFVSENNPDSPLESITSIGLNGRIPETGILPALSYTLSSENTTYEDRETARLSSRLSGRLKSLDFASTISWNYVQESDGDTPVDGIFQASGYVGRTRLTGNLQYDLGARSEVTQYGLSGYLPINQDISAGASLIQHVGENERTAVNMSLNWDNGTVNLSPSISYDTENGVGAFLTLSFSMGRDPVNNDVVVNSDRRAGTGATSAFVYHDANNNRKYDESDTPLPEVKVIARQARKNVLTNNDGVAFISGMTAYKPTDLEIDVDTLDDPFWSPAVEGAAVVPRAGSVNTLEFPVVTTGEIDGTVYYIDSNGAKRVNANVQLELVDSQGAVVQSTKSEYDGFYLLEKVFPGTYTLQVKSDDQSMSAGTSGLQIEVFIDNDGTIANGNDFVLPAPSPGEQNSDRGEGPITRTLDEFSPSKDDVLGVARQPGNQSASSLSLNPIVIHEKDSDESTPQTIGNHLRPLESSGTPIAFRGVGVAADAVTSESIDVLGRSATTDVKKPESSIRINPLIKNDKIGADSEFFSSRPKNMSIRLVDESETGKGVRSDSSIRISALEVKEGRDIYGRLSPLSDAPDEKKMPTVTPSEIGVRESVSWAGKSTFPAIGNSFWQSASVRLNAAKNRSAVDAEVAISTPTSRTAEEVGGANDEGRHQSTIRINPLVKEDSRGLSDTSLPFVREQFPENTSYLASMVDGGDGVAGGTRAAIVVEGRPIAENEAQAVVHLQAEGKKLHLRAEGKKLFIKAEGKKILFRESNNLGDSEPIGQDNILKLQSKSKVDGERLPAVECGTQTVVRLETESEKMIAGEDESLQVSAVAELPTTAVAQIEGEERSAIQEENVISMARLEHALDRVYGIAELETSHQQEKNLKDSVARSIINQSLIPPIVPIGRPFDLGIPLGVDLQERQAFAIVQKYVNIQRLG